MWVKAVRQSGHGSATRVLLGVGLVVSAVVTPALAHDTWFSPLKALPSGETLLALGTGNRYPLQEFNPTLASLMQSACRDASGKVIVLRALRDASNHLVMRAKDEQRTLAMSCWTELKAFEVDLPANKVAEYFREIRPSAAVQEAWADMQKRGVPWRERYVKYARIELGAKTGSAPADKPATPAPNKLAMDVLLETPARSIKPGAELVFQVLRYGRPLSGFAVELVSERQRFGIWRTTDAEGRVRSPVPFAGQWILRGTDLRLSDKVSDSWDSRFVTLAFEVPSTP